METVEFKIPDLYETNAKIYGYALNGQLIYPGFLNERMVPEWLKRDANRAGKAIKLEIELLDEQRKAIKSYIEENKTEEELIKIRDDKDKELVSSPVPVKVLIQKLDFEPIKNEKLSDNYTLLYEKIFKE